MSKILKTACGLLIASLAGTIAFFVLLVRNTQLDSGNEWFSYEAAIGFITFLAVLGTIFAFIGWKQPQGKKIAVGGLVVLLAYFFLYFSSCTSEKSSGSESNMDIEQSPGVDGNSTPQPHRSVSKIN